MTTLVDRWLIRLGLLPEPSLAVAVSLAALDEKARAKRLEAMRDVPRYPPFMEGLPVRSPLALLDTQEELTKGVQQLIANRELLDDHYNPAMLRLAQFVHMLPASQMHHHRGAGGLLRHSLEVGFWALQQTEGKLIRGVITPQKRRLIEPRWRLAAFLAGICHDLGKVVTDFTVTDREGGLKWRPYMQDLYQWADKNKVESYFIHWTEGRGRSHTNVSSTLIESVVSRKTLDWIGEGSTDVMIWLTESLNNNPGSSNQIHNFVVRADQLSVERDLKSMGAAMAGYEIGVPIERYLTDTMRRLVKEGLWRINEPAARVWNINGTTYLVWPMAGEEIARRTQEENLPGLPKTPDGILDMMVEREIAFLREDGGDDPFFYIAPDVVTEKIPAMRMRAIRLRDEALISTLPILPIAGKIYSSKTDPQDTAIEDMEQESVVANTDATSQSVPGPMAHLDKSDIEVKESQNVRSTPAAHLSERGADAAQSRHLSSTSVARVENPPVNLNSLDCGTGEAIRLLVADFDSGMKSFAELGIKQPDGSVYLKWPEVFAGYGPAPKEILDYFSENGWLIPAGDVAKIGDAHFSDGVAKAIGLTAAIGEFFIAAKPPGRKKTKSAPEPALPAPIQAVAVPAANYPGVTPGTALIAANVDAVVAKQIRAPAKRKTKAAGEIGVKTKPKAGDKKIARAAINPDSGNSIPRARHDQQKKGASIEGKTY